MKLIIALVLFLNFQSFARGFGQTKITLSLKSIELKQALLIIEKQSSYHFLFSDRKLESNKKVDVIARDEDVLTVLSRLLNSTGYTYSVLENNLIVITPESGYENKAEVKGVVKDAKGAPLSAVSVQVKGRKGGVVTDAEGKFHINAAEGDSLLINLVGFQQKTIVVGSDATIEVVLDVESNELSSLVVTSLGIKREARSLGYGVNTISSKQLTEAGNTNLGSALYGKAAGVKITTAPGGASSAVNIQIRGINSISYNQQPLYVVDGVVIRNDGQYGSKGANNSNFDDDQRIRGNGILDINPADIESMTILKGSSAAAVYGSDAANGVIVITTKKGTKGRGLGVDLNYNATMERAAFLPEFQNTYGPGYDRATNVANGYTADGWMADAQSPTGYHPYFRAYAQFGPKMEGQQVRWWDGSIRPFVAQENNYKDIFDKGYSSSVNMAVSNYTDKGSFRFSVNRLDYKGTNPGSKQSRNNFNLNSSIKLSDKVTADFVVNYVNTYTHNRAYLIYNVLSSFGGFFSRAEDMSVMKQRYQTSDGYKYSTNGTGRPEDFVYPMRATNLLDFFWNQLKNSYDETENRIIASGTLNWDVAKHVKFRTRLGSDYTGYGSEDKRHTEQAEIYNGTTSTGAYAIQKGQYSLFYGDALLTYNNKLGKDFDLTVTGGFQGRSEKYLDQNSSTASGLVSRDWFAISNSFAQATTTSTRRELLKYAYLGTVNLGYKNFLYLEATAREEYASPLPPVNNKYFYPSVNGSFVVSEAFHLPAFISYTKVRSSYAIVANGPLPYESNIAYTQTSLQSVNGSVPSLSLTGTYGNSNLVPEKKYEAEFGIEARFLNNRIGMDVNYYTNQIKNQIINLSTAGSVGAGSQIINVGEIDNKGLEVGLNFTPIVTKAFKWDMRVNYSFSKSKVKSLTSGLNQIVFYDGEQSAFRIVAGVGETLGNIYVMPRATNEKGELLINDDGLYVIDKSRYVKAGNIMPKAIGGISNTFTYKSFSLDFTADYRIGGQLLSPPTKYALGAGMYKSTLEYRDAAHGGLTYTDNGTIYNDGVLLKGVNQTTGATNTKVISAADYYLNTFNWGADAWNEKGAVYDNSYIKMREVVFGYRLPSAISNKMHLNGLKVSFIARNLFYIWKTMDNIDPESVTGNKWYSQGVNLGSSAPTRSIGISLNASF
ncbi:iron complex outermembrane recepter protein [Filimonas lacunae]|uniref:Iron complex outermembrane recepter protein n=1 Tax=Filimonas lacunae TaxID=477680 RepID=A0A173MMD5_9BACT|nr:SusC/RagA family TonB-linked outer membrane protein [Filimonas lacunae]BAV08794.1 outer membrane protein, nutrient binding [Filimonas lacunae]SIS61841.1 iron complex outermembrane recepter protein [Filimonas lacunae]